MPEDPARVGADAEDVARLAKVLAEPFDPKDVWRQGAARALAAFLAAPPAPEKPRRRPRWWRKGAK